MKIILSPSKTQDFTNRIERKRSVPYFDKKANDLAHMMGRMSKEHLSEVMHIKGDLLEETYFRYQSFDEAVENHAIYTYTGLVYKYMNVLDYEEDMLAYMEEHLCILSALYGVLKPFDGIRPYRLDMKMKVMEESLYSYWKEEMTEYFDGEPIINLASGEFSKLIEHPMVTIGFREYKDGKYKNLATYAKMARGVLLDYMIKNQVVNVDELKSATFGGYHYNDKLSNQKTIIFSRND